MEQLKPKSKMSLSNHITNLLANKLASWSFVMVFLFCCGLWMAFNVLVITKNLHFDEFPFIFLNLALSCLAAVQAPVIMMSQNFQANKDRHMLKKDLQFTLSVLENHKQIESEIAQLREVIQKHLDSKI